MAERGTGATTRSLRVRNRSLLLGELARGGPRSRRALAARIGLSPAAVSKVTAALMLDGLITETGTLPSAGGRPHVLLDLVPGAGTAVGLDLGETSVQARLYDLSLTPLAAADEQLPEPGTPGSPRDPAPVAAAMARVIVTTLASRPDESALLGVGIGVPGVVESAPEAVVHARAYGWAAAPVERLLRADAALAGRLGDAPILLENGATAMARAEHRHGAARGAQDSVTVLIGAGMGTGIIVEGSPYSGSSSGAGEWGHTTIVAGGRPCRCGGRGCLEAYVGGGAFLARCQELEPGIEARLTGLGEGFPLTERVPALFAARTTSPAVAQVVAESIEYLGIGLANLVNVMNPERVILGGWFGLMLGRELLEDVWRVTREQALPEATAHTSVHLAELGADAVAAGAATLVVDRFLAAGGAGD